MCGIAGCWGDGAEAGEVEDTRRRMRRLRHRGPDGQGLRPMEAGVLGHTRLAIMDPARGDQPHVGEDGCTALVANGEIYNHEALRASLGDHRFVSRSDTEVALHLLEAEGSGAVGRLDGMFALAHAAGDELVLGRDPLGIKPLYMARSAGDGVRFASEMKALQDVGDPITELPAGCVWSSRGGLRRYYRVPEPSAAITDPEEAAAEVRAALERAVRKRLMSDVPLGAFLSGGLDSSAIAALAMREMGELHTFSVGVEGSPDLDAAEAVARHIGSRHHTLVFGREEVESELERLIFALESFDRDLVRSAIPTFFTARLAARHVKVALTGEGADELFGGYSYVRRLRGRALAAELKRSLEGMHNLNLQRVDRLTMAHGLEARVPFLDRDMVALAQRIAPELKIRQVEGRPVEKWVLRRAVQDLLPERVVWRDKAQFDEGSGTTDLMAAVAGTAGTPGARLGVTPRSAEEGLYLGLFASAFERPEALVPNLGRWLPSPA